MIEQAVLEYEKVASESGPFPSEKQKADSK
jgi:hypothetical protein